MNEVKVVGTIGGRLFFNLSDGSAVNCICIKSPYTEAVERAVSERIERLQAKVAEQDQVIVSAGFRAAGGTAELEAEITKLEKERDERNQLISETAFRLAEQESDFKAKLAKVEGATKPLVQSLEALLDWTNSVAFKSELGEKAIDEAKAALEEIKRNA